MGWSNLPTELLLIIAKILTEYTDQIRFHCVCSHWRSAFPSLIPLPRPQLPWLLVPSNSSNILYSFSENRIYPLTLSVPKTAFLYGSPSGWLLSFKRQGCGFTYSITNPLMGVSIRLPCPKPYPKQEYPLFDMTPNSLIWDRSNSYVLVASRNKPGVFYCPVSKKRSWKLIVDMRYTVVNSITFYKSKFYIFKTNEIVVLDGHTLKRILVINPPQNVTGTHLVCGESLLLVKSHYEIYAMDLNKQLEWKRVIDIGDHAIFIDDLHCFSVEVDGRNKLKRNCIYQVFSENFFQFNNYGVTELELRKHTIRTVVKFPDEAPRGELRSPTWILPSLH